MALSEIFGVRGDFPRFLGRAHHRQHQALGAHIEGARDMVIIARRHAHDGRQLGRLHVAQHRLEGIEAEAAMLHVQEHIFAARHLHDLADTGRIEFDQKDAELGTARLRHVLQTILSHPLSPSFMVLSFYLFFVAGAAASFLRHSPWRANNIATLRLNARAWRVPPHRHHDRQRR